MLLSKKLSALMLTCLAATTVHAQAHFNNVLIVMFENMSYAEIKQEPTFKKLVEYTGNTLDERGKLIKLAHPGLTHDTDGNGYAFFSHFVNNHSGGSFPTRPSQPNYLALTSGSVHGIADNGVHNLNVDNLASELNEAHIAWKVYAEDLPDPVAKQNESFTTSSTALPLKPFIRDPNKSEPENDLAEQAYLQKYRKQSYSDFQAMTGCFIGESNVQGPGNADDGYKRKHEPFISYVDIQSKLENCQRIVNGSHLLTDLPQLAPVNFYIPNQIHDGHNGTLEERVLHANDFLSKMMGTNPKTGEPLPDAAHAPFQQFMAQGGLLIITFDEPSVTGNPDKTIYTLFAGKMVTSGVYPDRVGNHAPVCYPTLSEQGKYPMDENGWYGSGDCNHYNLLKMIEENFQLRGLKKDHSSSGYKNAFALDKYLGGLWK